MEFLKNILSEKTYNALIEKLGGKADEFSKLTSDFKVDPAEEKWIPKNKFDELNNQVKDYKSQIAQRDQQINDLGLKAKGNEDLTNQINALKSENEKTKSEYEQKITARERDYLIETALRANGARNMKAVKAVIDFDKIEVKDGAIVGLDEQLQGLKKSDAYLFGGTAPSEIGKNPRETTTTTDDKYAEFRNLR